jgi:hypothetical protein
VPSSTKMPGTNGEVRVGGCGAFGAEGGRVGAGTRPGSAGGGGEGVLAIGRRPAHPARRNAVKNGATSQPERESDASQGNGRSLTPGTAFFFVRLQFPSFPLPRAEYDFCVPSEIDNCSDGPAHQEVGALAPTFKLMHSWASAPCILFFVYDVSEQWRCSGGEAACPQGPSFGSRACASDRPPALFSKTEENQRPCEPALSRSVGDDSGSGSRNHSLLHGGSHGQV